MADRGRIGPVLVFAGACAITAPATAQDLTFKDKTVSVIVGFTPGGPPDTLGRAFADAMAKRLPGRPNVVVRNVPGAEGVVALNSFVAQTKPDGLTVAIGAGGNFDPLLNRESHAAYDPETLKYIGGLSVTGSVLLVNRSAVPRLGDKAQPPAIMGASNNLRTTMWGVVLGSALLGWNVRWVFGYPGTGDLQLALSKGEIDMTTLSDQNFIKRSLESGSFSIMFQTGSQVGGMEARPEIATASSFADLAKNAKLDPLQQGALTYWSNLVRVGSWLALVPDTPPAIVDAYRAAFHDAVNDRDFIDRTRIAFPDSTEVVGDDLARLASILAKTSPETLAYLEKLRESLRK